MTNAIYDFLKAQPTLETRIEEINQLLTPTLINTLVSRGALIEDSTDIVLGRGKDEHSVLKGAVYLVDTGSGPVSRAIIAGFYKEGEKTNALVIDQETGWCTYPTDNLVGIHVEFR